MNSPVLALIIFFVICISLYIFFRAGRGLYWRIQSSLKQDTKIIVEDILKMLYHAEYAGKKVEVGRIFEKLKDNRKQLLEVLKKIESEGLITSTGDEVSLNASGRKYALMIIRAHRLWEKYLSEETGYDKQEWHDRAEEMEHEITEEQANKLSFQLGNPRYDPHGDPIPSSDGEIPVIKGQALPSFPAGTIGRITHIEDEPDIIYKQILAEDLHIGSQLRIVENNKQRIVFHSEGEENILAPIVAANITMVELKNEEVYEKNIMRLSNLMEGERAKIRGISQECKGENRRRLLDLGIVMGTEVSIDITSPLNNPKGYLIRNTVIAIRNEQASLILIEKLDNE